MTDDKPDAGGTDAQRLERLEQRQEQTDGKLDEILGLIKGGITRADGEDKGAGGPADRPGSVAEQVRAELERARKEDADRAAADAASAADAADRESTRARLAKLEERPPARPQPRRERVMWGRQR